MELKHQFAGEPRLWIARSTAGKWYLYKEISGGKRARLLINELYAKALIENNNRFKAEQLLGYSFL